MNKYFIFALLWLFSGVISAQELIKGYVVDEQNNPIVGVNITLKEGGGVGVATDAQGAFTLYLPPQKGKSILVFSHLNYQPYQQEVKQGEGTLYVMLEPKVTALSQVVVQGKTPLMKLKESEFAVSTIDLKAFHNSSSDLPQVLDKISGVKVQQSGGLGSQMNLSLNGFRGNHVKVFVDGVPMEGMGPTLQLNNIPLNNAERIEVYKGVVPTHLSSDALGGAVNIVTKATAKQFLDVSYSYGSFNTHKTYLNASHSWKNGLSLGVNAYQNYSDNNYWVKVKILDFTTNTYSTDKQRVRRFHNQYHNESVALKLGLSDKSFADRLFLGFVWANLYDQVQHAADMDKAFGDKYRQATTLMPTLFYSKKDLFISDFSLSLHANYNFGESHNEDTGRYRYNWLGERKAMAKPGEQQLSDYRFKNHNALVSLTMAYHFLDKHTVELTDTYTLFNRTGYDRFREFFTKLPTRTDKSVLGVSYKYQSERWNTTAFYKSYWNDVKAFYTSQQNRPLGEFSYQTEANGYGLAATYHFTKVFQLKASVENALRLPTSRELFGIGDGIESQNPALRPERSWNLNLGSSLSQNFGEDHQLVWDVNLARRQATDFINRRNRNGIFVTENFGDVQVHAADTELRYFFRQKLSAGVSATFQDMRNKQRYIEENGQHKEHYFYNERLPNIPYLFGNADLSYTFDRVGADNKLILTAFANYFHSFANDWQRYQAAEEVPQQLTLDFSANYSLKRGRYNLSFDITDILDTDRYDNYNLQKPGRSLAVKLRMFLQ